MTCLFVSIQGTYNKIELALFNNAICLQTVSKTDAKASSSLVPLLNDLLSHHNLSLKDLAFIAVDKGPGAFTSLRVTIASVNGIAFSQKIPLIGINSLEALAHQASPSIPHNNEHPSLLVCLLNAYNNDVYYLIQSSEETIDIGCKKIDDLLTDLQEKTIHHQLWGTGNGFEVHREIISQALGNKISFIDPFISICSAQAIGQLAYKQWEKGQGMVDQIAPLYLKTQLFAVKK